MVNMGVVSFHEGRYTTSVSMCNYGGDINMLYHQFVKAESQSSSFRMGPGKEPHLERNHIQSKVQMTQAAPVEKPRRGEEKAFCFWAAAFPILFQYVAAKPLRLPLTQQ